MNKNKKIVFFMITLIILLTTITAAAAANNTADQTISEKTMDSHVEKIQTTSDPIIKNTTNTKEISKQTNEKNVKTATKTVEVNNYDELITEMNNAVQDTTNDEYIINLNEGTYQKFANPLGDSNVYFNPGNAQPNITINGNHQQLTGAQSVKLYLNNSCNNTFNNLTFQQTLYNYANTILNNVSTTTQIYSYGNLTLQNMNLNTGLYNYANLIIGENVSFMNGFFIFGDGNVITDDESKIIPYYMTYNGTYTIENETITIAKTNYGNLTIKNSTINAKITNNGNLTICDDVTFGSNFELINNGEVTTNITNKIVPYLSTYDGNYTLENITISKAKTNNGNLTVRNSTISAAITNNGNLTFDNDTFTSGITHINNVEGVIYLDNLIANNTFTNEGTIIVGDNVTYGEKFIINGNGVIVSNDTTSLTPHIGRYNGNYTIENITDKNAHSNVGNLTIKNSTMTGTISNTGTLYVVDSHIKGSIANYGTMYVINSTLNSSVTSIATGQPTGTFIFDDNVIFGNKFSIKSSDYIIIMNDTTRITPYLTYYKGDKVLENYTIKNSRTNMGNLTMRNVTLNYAFTNKNNLILENSTLKKDLTNEGTVTIRNSTLNARIMNSGTVIIEDGNTFGTSFMIQGGKVVANNINEVFPYISEFTGETIIELGDYTKTISNSGNLTIENSTLTNNYANYNNQNGKLIIRNSTIQMNIQNNGILELRNVTLNGTINNQGTLILGDDIILGENFNITGNGEVITNDTERFIDYINTYTGDTVLDNKNITTPKTNKGTLTLDNCIINSTIRNDGKIIIDDNTVFGENARITGIGEIVTNDIISILPIIDAINGNFVINDVALNKSYVFNGRVTLNNCTTNSPNNTNFGTLNLNNCTVDVGEENKFIDNMGTLHISKDTEIIGIINKLSGDVIDEGAPKTYIVNNNTITYYFTNEGISSMINPGDILDFQGTITTKPDLGSIIINKPVNIISSTHDGRIENFAVVNFTKGSSGSNVTGLYTHNTQFYVWNADHIVFDNISNVVEDKQVGWGVGQTSIRENSSYITVKNSYFYTKNNGGSSTLVLAWANYCTIMNNTIIGGGNNGNLLYLTTYNVEIPSGALFNSYNRLINNTLIGPDTAADICYGICLSGSGNLVDGNSINYTGNGIMAQWGSGVTGDESEESAFESTDNIVRNNKLYGGCGISGGNIVYNNYIEGPLSISKSIAYNNTANRLSVNGENTTVYNNTILGNAVISNAKNSLIEDNIIKGNITINSASYNITITGNNITGTITLDGSNNTITNNNITTDEEYTISSKRSCKDNVITDNYLMANAKGGDASVSLRDASNIIENNLPINTKITIIAQSEATVNKTVPVTIMLTDFEDNLLQQQEVTITTDSDETITLKNGVTVYQYTTRNIGEEIITVSFNGKDDYYASVANITITVTEDKDKIIENLTNTIQEQNDKIEELTQQNAELNNTINSQSDRIDELEEQINQLTAAKATTIILDSISDAKYNANVTISGMLINDDSIALSNQIVTLTIGDKTVDVKTRNGVFEYTTRFKTLDEQTVTAAYAGNDKYLASEDTTTFTIAKQDVLVTYDVIKDVKYGENVTITGKFTDSEGKAITNSNVKITIDGKKYYAKTDKNGLFTLSTKVTTIGENEVTIGYSGNANYNAYETTTTFNVEKQDVIITYDAISNVNVGENVTITGTFKDASGKAVANSNVKIIIDGKKYYAKTDSKGAFTFSAAMTKAGVKTVSIGYSGNANYNEYTSETTFTVLQKS